MKMITHQTIGVDLPIRFGARFAQRFQKTPPVQVVFEAGFATVTTIHHVTNSGRILDAKLAGHDGEATERVGPVKPSFIN